MKLKKEKSIEKPNLLRKQEKPIRVENSVSAPIEKVWDYWTEPEHIKKWNSASDDWHTPQAENDLRVGGKFLSRMEAKNKSKGFDFTGTYKKVEKPRHISYAMEDGRKVNVNFSAKNNGTMITETFDPETTHSREMQQSGWQAILDNFKKYVEASNFQ
ncbi:MAG TPA: SRPBCC family protein [Flavobacteriaceae bacterium]|nr:SRPBCC family protein [Flavobacteriaceae bacterium]